MDTTQRLFELQQAYETCLDDITTLQRRLEIEESKLFKCQKEIRQIKEDVTI